MFKYQKQENRIFRGLRQMLWQMDVFGLPPNFRIFKQEKFNTNLGLVSSLGALFICIFYIQAQISDLLSYNHPTVVMSELQPKNGMAFPLQKNNFTFVLTVTDSTLTSYTTLNTYFNLTVIQNIRTRKIDESGNLQITWNATKIPLEVCNMEKHFTNDYQKEYFAKFRLGHMYCIDSDYWDNSPPILQGHTQADQFALLSISFTKCQNSTNYSGCASDEEIVKNMKSGYYVVYLSDSLSQMNLPDRPYEDIITLQYTPFSIQQSSQVSSIMKLSETITDYGLIKSDYMTEQALTQDNVQTVTSPYNSQYIVQNNIFFQQRHSLYTRSYVKIQTILGSVGGLWQIITSVIAVLLYPILFTSLNLTMANKLFSFENANSLDNQIISVANSMGFQNLGRSDGILENSVQKIDVKKKARPQEIEQAKTQIELKKFLKNKQSQLVFGVLGAIQYTLGCKKNKERQIKYAMDKILRKLDVCCLLQKISELDKLKDVLLSKEQLALFNYIPRPLIPCDMFDNNFDEKVKELEERKEYQFILREEKSSFLKINDAYNAFTKIKKKECLEKTDQLILSYLDSDIRKLFEKIWSMQEEKEDIMIDHIQVSQVMSPVSHEDIQLFPEPSAQKVQNFFKK